MELKTKMPDRKLMAKIMAEIMPSAYLAIAET